MNPQAMSEMMNLMNNPQMMDKMSEMMQNPKIQEVLNNPDLMSNMMNIFGQNLDGNSTPSNVSEIDNPFIPEDIVILKDLKSDKYNGKRAIIESYNKEKERYVVLLDNDENTKIMVKVHNLELEVEEIRDEPVLEIEDNTEDTPSPAVTNDEEVTIVLEE